MIDNYEEIYLYEGADELLDFDLDALNAADEIAEEDRIFWAAEAEKAGIES